MQTEELKKTVRAIDLAVAAGRKRQSPRTGFVHLFPLDDAAVDTIPIYENFCFALALFRQKTAESVLEGKGLIERLLAFQTAEGNFPLYLHDFPRCWDVHLPLKIAPILIHLLREFSSVLNSEYRQKIEMALANALAFSQEKNPTHPLWRARLAACLGEAPIIPPLSSAQEWLEWLISSQLVENRSQYPVPYHASFQLFLGEHSIQEKGEPQPTPIEYLLAEKQGIGARLLRDHPNQISAAPLYPFSSSMESTGPMVRLPQEGKGLRLVWSGETIHSLLIPSGFWEGDRVMFELPAGVEPSREDLVEVSAFTDISPETSLWIGDQKGMIFRMGETVFIHSAGVKIGLLFTLIEGVGDFVGHICRSNRPGQIACRGAHLYDTYDWKISLRTLRRAGVCKISLKIHSS